MSHNEEPAGDAVEAATARLDEAEAAGDPARLKVLDDLYASLEGELDRESDQAGSPRR